MLEKESPQSHAHTPNVSLSPEARLMCGDYFYAVVSCDSALLPIHLTYLSSAAHKERPTGRHTAWCRIQHLPTYLDDPMIASIR